MLQVTFDPDTLSKEQRAVIASFVLGYPAKASECSHTCATVSHLTGHAENLQLASEQAHDLTAPEAVAAFGGGQVTPPLAVPFSAAAPLPQIAPVAPLVSLVPPSAIVPPAPTNVSTVSPVVPTIANPVTTDKAGFPWDGRIHSESKALNVDGTWRKRRNLDPAVLVTVEAELKQLMGLAFTPAPVVSVAPPPASSEPIWPFPTEQVAYSEANPALQQVAPPPSAPAGDARAQYIALVGRASAAMNAGKVSAAEITQACNENGIPALPLLANRLDLVPQVAFAIDAIIAVWG